MIKSYNASTLEVDYIDVALEDIFSQIDIENDLLTNSVGLLLCHADFISSGVVEALCQRLPFDVVGSTTLSGANSDSDDPLQLMLMVLTSDDVKFGTGLTESFAGETPELLVKGYEKAMNEIDNKPELAIVYAPLLMNVSGDFFVKELDKLLGGVPQFGMTSVDHNIDYHESVVIYNGEAYSDSLALLLIDGDVQPKFFIGALENEKILLEKSVITSSNANQLFTVNDIPIEDYLKKSDLATDADGNLLSVNGCPFILDYGDGTSPVIRALIMLTPDGTVICGGEMPEGALLTVGYMDENTVFNSTKKMLDEMEKTEHGKVTLFCSCIGRYAAQGFDPEREKMLVKEKMDEMGQSYMFAYCGGEICVVDHESSDGEIHNRYHNDTIVACTF